MIGGATIPDFIQLQRSARQVAENAILVFQARLAHLLGQLLNGVDGHARDASGGADRETIDKAAKEGTAVFRAAACSRQSLLYGIIIAIVWPTLIHLP